jgi:hypothetical protein
VSCVDVTTATGVAGSDVIAAELWLVAAGAATVLAEQEPECNLPSSPPGLLLTEYILDLCSLEPVYTRWAGSGVLRPAASILASQWLNEERRRLFENNSYSPHLLLSVLDELQICISQVAKAINNHDSVDPIISSFYRLNGKSVIPKHVPAQWETSRSYLASLFMKEYDAVSFSTPKRRSSSSGFQTPVSQFCPIRVSTLNHAAEWLSLQRSRSNFSAHKRHRSSCTPRAAKRIKCEEQPVVELIPSDHPILRQADIMSTPQRPTTRKHVTISTTPRRSLRIQGRTKDHN